MTEALRDRISADVRAVGADSDLAGKWGSSPQWE
jgi:hypothetical protein